MKTAKTLLVLALGGAAVLMVAGNRTRKAPGAPTDYQAYTARSLREHFPNVILINQDRKKVRFYDDVIKGKVVMIQFMFANCQRYCPMVTPNLVKVQQELQRRGDREVKMLSITVDPAHDTPAVLKEYAGRFHVQPGWQFLTGHKEDIDLIRRELGVWDSDGDKLEHMNVLTIGKEPTGQWLALEALAKPEDIADTVLRLTTHAGFRTNGLPSITGRR